jgi:O-Antigen ligase
VPVDTSATLAESPSAKVEAAPRARIEERAAAAFLAMLPGALVVYFAFEGGGYFAGSVAFIALLITQIVIVRVLVAERPFAGFTRRHAIVVGVFAGYAGWTLASALWSNAEDRALVEFDRALLYLLLLLLFGLLPRRRWRVPWMMRGLAGGSLVVCTVSLTTRLLPHVWPTAPGLANNRLSYPITYWNALGILASIGILLMLGIASNPRERRVGRALAAAGVPIAATTLLLTFSRGAIIALLIGLVAFLVIGRSRALVGALLATVPATAIALVVTYHANLLATLNPTTPAAVVQGHRVAIVVAISALAAGIIRWGVDPLERWLANARPRFAVSRGVRRGGAAAVLAAVLAAAIAAGGPAWISRQVRLFSESAPVPTTDLTARLTDPSSNGRTDQWRVALKGFVSAPVAGNGAGTYEFEWYRHRLTKLPVVDAHNLYLETLTELGVIGLLLLAGTLAAILVALARRVSGPNRVVYAALFSAALAWAVHAAVDWDWEMPVVTAWVFAIGGAALGTGEAARSSPVTGARGRVPLAAALLVAAVTPALLMLSQAHLQRAADAFDRGSCARAEHEAVSSINVLAVRPEPYQILGYCDISDGRAQDAVAAMRKAVQQEPGSWEYHYGLAIAEGYAGIDPRPELATAVRLDPGEPLVQPLLPVLRTHSPAAWLAAVKHAYSATFASGRLTLR